MKVIAVICMAMLLLSGCHAQIEKDMENSTGNLEIATLGAGCFWCVEAVFQRIDGVEKVVSGYSGGKIKNPTYREVCSGLTGHAEVIQVYFNPAKVSFSNLLEVFFKTHDPTTLNKQGADEGTQYRSVVFYHSEEQRTIAEKVKSEIDKARIYDAPIVTEVSAFTLFYPAEDYHQNYYNQNGSQPYCRVVINPKVAKLEHLFSDMLKK